MADLEDKPITENSEDTESINPVESEDFADDPVIDESENETIPFRYSITSYGADYPVDGLINRLNSEKIFIPKFQRQYVWKLNQASRFIESVLLGLPVPGVFLSRDPDSSKLLVIDGQQRLRTLQYFMNGVFNDEKVFRLKGVQSEYEGLSYEDLPEILKIEFSDYIIHATVVRQDEPTNDQSSIFHIFERLNTGGTPLQPQEIRACIYFGEFNELLGLLNTNPHFREVYGRPNPRLKDQELILRFLGLYFSPEEYIKPMKSFLNLFMGNNRHLGDDTKKRFTDIFNETISTINQFIERRPFRLERGINTAFYDSVMVGVARRLEKGPITSPSELSEMYNSLFEHERFIALLKSGTSDEQNVKDRIAISTEIFQQIK